MAAGFLLIDGYNLLHAAGMAHTQYAPGQLQRSRERLLRLLASGLSASEIARTMVIFDARDPPPDRPARQAIRGIQIHFANPSGDADEMIIECLATHSAPRRVTLVSSDRALQRAARRHRAAYVDSGQFFDMLSRRARLRPPGRESPADEKPSESLSPEEAAHWMGYFGEIEVSKIPADEEPAAASPAPSGASPPQPPPDPAPSRDRRKSVRGRKSAAVPADELAFWMALFGNLPEAAQLGRNPGLSQADIERWLKEFEGNGD